MKFIAQVQQKLFFKNQQGGFPPPSLNRVKGFFPKFVSHLKHLNQFCEKFEKVILV